MAMPIVEVSGPVTGGIDTHLDAHVAAVVDVNGGVLAVESFPTTTAGFAELHDWLVGFGGMECVGVEGTGAYGAGLARHLRGWGLEVIEVDRANRQARRRAGKSDPADAIEAARAVLAGRATGIAKSGDGPIEAMRSLLIAKRSGREARISCLNQLRHLGFCGVPMTGEKRSAGFPPRRWPHEPRGCDPGLAATTSPTPPSWRCAHPRPTGAGHRNRQHRTRHPARRPGRDHRWGAARRPGCRCRQRRHPARGGG
jgi:hypothetical protein